MYYHESLPALVATVVQAGLSLDAVAAVRDGAGRLILVVEDEKVARQLVPVLRERLGPYAAPLPALGGPSAKQLLAGGGQFRTLLVDGNAYEVRYFDRRIVGADWLVPPSPGRAPGPPRLVFGSLKGGVGRSTAMAVLAADLSRAGHRVLAIDLDIEAPGLGFLLLPQATDAALDARPKFGTIDFLVENGIGGVSEKELSEFVGVSPLLSGMTDIVPAVGRATDELPHLMMEKLSRALVEDASPKFRRVIEQVSDLVDAFASREDYDAILIDARAGLGEITASPMLGLGADILLFGTDQPQTFRGYRYLLAHMKQALPMADGDDWRERLHFVQAKAPSAVSKRASFRDSLQDLCADFLYDQEELDAGGRVVPAAFNPSPAETGVGVPHDATYIEYHPNYDAFDPATDPTQLDADVMRGPYGAFLEKAWGILGLTRSGEFDAGE